MSLPDSSPLFSRILVALAGLSVGPLGAAPSAVNSIEVGRGRVLFEQNCALCHATGLSSATGAVAGQGPSLAGVVGRRAATRPDFGYSKSLKASGLTWDHATLDRFLAAPGDVVPGTLMVISIPRASSRRELISYLETLSPVSAAGGSRPVAGSETLPADDAGDWRNDHPGVRHQVRVADLPAPFASTSVSNQPLTVDRPAGAALAVPPGFTVRLFASDLTGPRLLRAAPNGDIFVAETRAGRVRVLRAADGADAPTRNEVFAAGLRGPFGIAFYPQGSDPQWVYVANINSVVRFPYRSGDLRARGPAETVVPALADTTGGHSTRDVVFSPDGGRLFISVGSGSNVAESMDRKSPAEIRAWEAEAGLGAGWGYENRRADVLVTDPTGRTPLRRFATGIRNAVGLAVDPSTGRLWVSTNERDGLGDDLVPDYISHIEAGAYYGWPWYYMGNHEDPRHPGERPDLAGRATVPDVPVQSHSASLQLTFYTAAGSAAFPPEYRGDIFAAFHGSWNRLVRTGSKVVRVHLRHGAAVGGYEDFMTGFVVDNRHVWGRPVGVAVARDGALLVSEDANDTIWRVAYVGR